METPFEEYIAKILNYPINIDILDNQINVAEYNMENFLEIQNNNQLIDNYPAVYIFYNAKSMYIGESVHPFKRLKQHYHDNRLELNDKIIVFRSEQFHKSAIYDIETQLIDLALSEGKIKLRNKSTNQDNYLYFLKEIYQPVLKDI